MDGDALLGEGLAREVRDLGVLGGKDAGEHLDHGHFGAEAAVEARELDADGAGAHNQQRLGKARRDHRLLVGPDQPAVGLEARQGPRPRAGGDDDVPGLDIGKRLARFANDGDRASAFQPRRPVDHGDVVLPHEIGDAVGKPLGHFAAPLDHRREIEADIVGGEPELGRVPHRPVELGGAEQRLGGDAAPVEADAAEMLALDDRGLHAELRRADGGDIAAGAGADDGEIEARVSHGVAARLVMGTRPTPAWSRGLRYRP